VRKRGPPHGTDPSTHPDAPHLRLSGIIETLEVRNRQAVEQRSSFVKFLTTLLHDEHYP